MPPLPTSIILQAIHMYCPVMLLYPLLPFKLGTLQFAFVAYAVLTLYINGREGNITPAGFGTTLILGLAAFVWFGMSTNSETVQHLAVLLYLFILLSMMTLYELAEKTWRFIVKKLAVE